jgi:hypothetical protein
MRHDVSLTMCFHTLWCRLYQTSEFSASCRPRPRARAVAAWPLARAGGTGGASLRGFVPSYSYGIRYSIFSLTNRNASMYNDQCGRSRISFSTSTTLAARSPRAPRLTRHRARILDVRCTI